jgi:paraquat-inducible protein B
LKLNLGVPQGSMGVRRAPPVPTKRKSVTFDFPPGTTLKASRTSRSQLSRSAALALAGKQMLKKENDALRTTLARMASGIVPGLMSGGIASTNGGSAELQKVRERLVAAQTLSSGLGDVQRKIRAKVAELNALDSQQASYRNGVMNRIAVLRNELKARGAALNAQMRRIKTPQDRAAVVQQRANLAMKRDGLVAGIQANAVTYNTGVAQRRTDLQASLAALSSEYESAQRASQDAVSLQRRATELSSVIEVPPVSMTPRRRRSRRQPLPKPRRSRSRRSPPRARQSARSTRKKKMGS